MRVLVSGGAGFIGSHLVDKLLALGHDVKVIDDLSTGREKNLTLAKSRPNFRFINKSINEDISSEFENIDWVFHLAGLADIVPSIEKPLPYHKSNVDGTVAVLNEAKLSGVKKLVYAASSSCYGIPSELPTTESARCEPKYPYALTKYIGEQYVMAWNKYYDLPTIALRLFNVYGPRSRTSGTYGAVMGAFLAQKLNGLPFTRVGDGNQKRDFVYVSDVVDAFIRAAESSISGEIINIGRGVPRSINELIYILGGPKAKIADIPKRPGEPNMTWADIHRAKHLLGWEPKVTLEEGVAELLKHIDDYKDAPLWTPEKIDEATKEWFRYLGDKEK